MESILQKTDNKEITISSLLNEITNLTEENNVIIKDIHEYKKELNELIANQNNEFINLSQTEIDEKLNNILEQVLNEEETDISMIEQKDENIVENINQKENINNVDETDNNSESTIDKDDLDYNSDNSVINNNENKVENTNDTINFMNISLFSEVIKNMDKNKSSEKIDISNMKDELNKMKSLFSNLRMDDFADMIDKMTNLDNFNKNETEDLESFILDNDNKNSDAKLSDAESYDITDDESSEIESSENEDNTKDTNVENLQNNIFGNFGNLFNLEFLTNKLGLKQNLNNKQVEEDLNDFVDDQDENEECEKVECITNDNKKLDECLNQNTKIFDELTNMMKGLGLNLPNSENINKEKKD
jgi:hypothetical protein